MILTASLVKTSLFLVPTLSVQLGDVFYLRQVSSAECSPSSVTRWNPKTVTWIIESGVEHKDIRAFVGHKSYHSVDSLKKLDSYDYIGIEYKKEF
jgi:hypothetical protein